ncbi:putative phage-type endonuclease [Pseudomonas sp. SJZ085]|uniref:YqaJ viral recombinase family protein n=1 Tax=unclassified Pseudomonas TaxID=196821 RepID=UPI0011999868|nr:MULTISPECIES: YqaJ viral recombinase family protein [unclassified Pseudomonas]TWC18152.1 putative phage-type endonuclease [Pseudomonas sp. SJZ074]TWC36124.1 putative phage-type endonuclease [Pseudomonas sp. SJZ085]
MIIHNVAQGSAEWLALRGNHFTASEAPAMMGASKYQTRSELLAMKKTGITPEVTPQQQRIFDKGHAAEELARPLVEARIGEELYPVVGTEGNLLASMDGLTMLGDTLWEHKLWNEALAAQVRAGELDPHYYWQLEQQLLVSGAERVIFTVSDGTDERSVDMEYRPVDGRAEQLIAGWAKFEEDLGAFEVQEVKPEVVGSAPDQLPALRIDVTGMVTASNLDAFKSHALKVISNINTQLSTDKDFADADETVKWCGEVEDKLKAAKEHALSQTESIDVLFKAIDDIAAETRRKRLELTKLIAARKEFIRSEIVMDAAKDLQVHIDKINATLGGRIRMPKVLADFAGAIKGKKNISSLKEAAANELNRAMLEANNIADKIRLNLASLRDLAANHAFLFHDAQELVLKANDDLVALIKVRINEHDQEQAELKRQVAEKAQEAADQQQPQVIETVVEQPAPVAVTPIKAAETPATGADDGQRLKLGELASMLGFTLSADFLRSLGFEAVERKQGACLYRAIDFPAICAALINHIQAVQNSQAAA